MNMSIRKCCGCQYSSLVEKNHEAGMELVCKATGRTMDIEGCLKDMCDQEPHDSGYWLCGCTEGAQAVVKKGQSCFKCGKWEG